MKCAICGSENASHSGIGGQPVLFCNNCGGSFRQTKETKKFYDKEYFEKCYTGNDNDISRIRIAKRYVDELAKYKKTGKLLEIGCAGGHLLKVAQTMGFDPTGIEIGKFASDYARKKFKARVVNKDVESAIKSFKGKTFDAVVMINLLENVRHPLFVMKEVHRVLKDNGAVLACVPSYNHLFKKTYPKLRVTFFTPKSFRKMCYASGFSIVSMRTRLLSYIADNIQQKIFFRKHAQPAASKETNFDKAVMEMKTPAIALLLDSADKTPWGVSIHAVLKKAIK